MPGPSTRPLLSRAARSQPGGVRGFSCAPPTASTTSPPSRPWQPLGEGTPGWSSPPPPRTSPDAFAVSPRGREGSSRSGDLPAPRCHLGLRHLARERLPVAPAIPTIPVSSRGHGSATTAETNPRALLCWPRPKRTPSAGPRLSPAPAGIMALLAPVPPSTSGSSGFGWARCPLQRWWLLELSRLGSRWKSCA